MPHRKEHVLADVAKGGPEHVAAGDRRRPRGARRLVAPAVGGARVRLPPRGRAARRPVALDARRRDDAEPVEDPPPGRDRRRRRADRLLALQRRVHAPDLRGAAGLLAGRLEPDGVPPARGLRLRGQPVQLHRDRRQPQRLARADGEHRRLEARVDRRALRALHAAAAEGGRPARRRHQPRLRLGRHDRRRRAREPGARRDPLHRLDARLPEHVEDGRQQHRELPELPAHRRRDGRQGLHHRARERRRRRGRDGDRARLLRVPGPEVLGRVAGLRAEEHVAGAARAARGPGRGAEDGRRRRLLQLHGRRHRRQLVQDAEGGDRRGARVRRRPRSSPAAATTTPRATSSSRR